MLAHLKINIVDNCPFCEGVVDNIGNPTGYPVNKLGKGDYAICIGYMLQSARGEYIAQNACITGSPLLISLVLARCLNSRSLGSEFEMVVAVCKFSS